MKHILLGKLDVSRIGLGAMSMSGYYNFRTGSDAESIRTIHRALELGVTHLDTAEIYGGELVAYRGLDGLRSLCGATGLTLRHVAALASRDELRSLFNTTTGRLTYRTVPRSPYHALLELRARRWAPGVVEPVEPAPQDGRSAVLRVCAKRWALTERRVIAYNALELRYNDCLGIATEVDHIVGVAKLGVDRGRANDPANLQAVCTPCHRRKTRREAAEGSAAHNRTRAAARRARLRVREQPHPGS